MKKMVLLLFVLICTLPAFGELDDGIYEELMYKTKFDNGEITLFKVACYRLNGDFCNLETITLTNDKKKHSPCGIYSAVKFNGERATRKANGSWIVSRKKDVACDKHEEYTFTKNGMVNVVTASSKPFNKEQEAVCKKFAPEVLNAEFVDGISVKNLEIEGCKKMEIFMFSGGLPF